MTLVTRVSLFFLGTLAVTLGGFSATLYLIVAGYLDRHLDQQLESALVALIASVEIEADAVEWEPHERRLELAGVRWVVRDPRGLVVGLSSEPFPEGVLNVHEGREVRLPRVADSDGEPWRVSQVRLAPAQPGSLGDIHEPGKYSSLTLTAAAPVGPVAVSLRLLGWTLAGLSLAVWSAAALVGRRLCRKALAPIARMADSARSISAAEPGRLYVAPTGDELEQLGRSFNGLLDRLQEAFERQRRFTGEASHQLRTPLAVLLGQIEVALRRDRPAEEYRRVLGIAADQAGRLHRIVEMLLFLARADAEAALPGVSSLALRPWLDEHLKTWATHPRAADIRADIPAEVCARAHGPLLGQVLDILLENAMNYSPPGSRVVLSLGVEGERVLLSVEDAGSGIDPEDLPHVFEPFFRSPRQRGTNTGGVGLGLAIARRAVASMGGEIGVEGVAGGGTRFVMRLAHPDMEDPNDATPTDR